jgi:anti-sigma factor RsiW
MCDFSKKLIARMDGELSEGEAAELERHLSACAECRNRLATYERASSPFDAYCEATFAAETRRKSPRWLPDAVATGIAAAAVIAALLILPYQRVTQLPPRASTPTDAPHVAAQPAEPTVIAPNLADAAHPIVSAIDHAPRQYVAAAVPRGRNVERETASAAPVQSSQARNLSPFPPEPYLEITIPADAMFPAGAVPPGMSFAADLTISADGSPEQLGLRPRLAGFERRRNQP